MIRSTSIPCVLAAAALAGCYKPAVGDCEYLCAADNSCPNDLKCDPNMNLCREPALMGVACGAPPPDDVAPDMNNLCGWSYQPLNFDPCDLPMDPVALTVTTNGLVLDSDTGKFGGTTVPHTLTADDVTIFHFSSVNVGPGIEIITAGRRAILIAVSGDVEFDGIISVDATNSVSAGPGGGTSVLVTTRCQDGTGHDGTAQGGGGGGGLGQAGANGAGNFGAGGLKETGFTPLRGGCSGGFGGNAGSAGSFVGAPGGAGGAIQISARGTLLVNGGQIRASGGGGLSGRDPAPSGGGGGGGSGGTILLEGTTVTISNASLCANGGGGGGGGTSVNTPAGSGALGTCASVPAAGGTAGGAAGGHGGGMVVPATGSLAAGTEGSGGGGGGAGVIHVVGHPTKTIENTSLVTPPES